MKKKSIFQILLLQLVFILAAISLVVGSDSQNYQATYGKGDQVICVATGSPGALGLLQALAEPFCQTNHCRVNWVKKGSGASLKALKEGSVDMVMCKHRRWKRRP